MLPLDWVGSSAFSLVAYIKKKKKKTEPNHKQCSRVWVNETQEQFINNQLDFLKSQKMKLKNN